MSVSIKTAHEIQLMRHAGKLLEQVHDELAKIIRPGISTWEIDHEGERMIRELGCVPNFLNYEDIPPLSVYRSMTRWFTEFQKGEDSQRRGHRQPGRGSDLSGISFRRGPDLRSRKDQSGSAAAHRCDKTVFLRELNMPGPAAISMRFQRRSEPMPRDSAMEWFGIWLVTGSERIFTRIPRFLILPAKAGDPSAARYDPGH